MTQSASIFEYWVLSAEYVTLYKEIWNFNGSIVHCASIDYNGKQLKPNVHLVTWETKQPWAVGILNALHHPIWNILWGGMHLVKSCSNELNVQEWQIANLPKHASNFNYERDVIIKGFPQIINYDINYEMVINRSPT